MRIGELASRTGVSVRALRYYEEQQLLTASRSATGQRLYDDDAVRWVDLIQQLYAAGLSSSTILKLLPCVKEQDPHRSPHSHALLHAERTRIDEQIAALQRTRDTLDSVIVAAAACATLHPARNRSPRSRWSRPDDSHGSSPGRCRCPDRLPQ